MSPMIELLTRAARSAPDSRAPVPPGSSTTVAALGAGIVAAGASLLVVAVIVIATWATALRGGAGAADALRAVAYVWLVAHRVAITVAGGHVALLPIGLLAVPAYALFRAGSWFAHAADVADMRGVVTGGLTMGIGYGFVAAVVASGSATHTVHP